jgi:ankyrin repeat protein
VDRIFESVLAGEKATARALRSDPLAHRTTMSRDVLVDAIPHWLYVGDTPLHAAAAALRPGVVAILLESGADPNAVNRRGATPLHYACDPRPRFRGTGGPAAQAAVIAVLAKHGADLNRGDRGGATPLHRAVRARSAAAVRQLLALGARTDGRLRTRGSTPLHLAAQSTGAGGTAGALDEQLEIIALFRQHGADFAAVDAAGRTPQDWAKNPRVAAALAAQPPALPPHRRSARRGR